ncbi:hypothetical protein ACHAWX_004121 [Stephanocyclus meneghinianus]
MKFQVKIVSLHAAAVASLVALVDAQQHNNYTTLGSGMCVDSDKNVFSGLRYNQTAGNWGLCGNLCETLNTLPHWNNHNGISLAGLGAQCTCLYDSVKSIPQNLPDGWSHYTSSTTPSVGFGKVQGRDDNQVMYCMQRKCYPDCGPLSYDLGLADFEDKSIDVDCDVNSMLDLVCNATTDAFKGGVMNTSLSEGMCEAGSPATNVASSQKVSLDPSLTCKNSGTCNFTHCFQGDYSFNSLDVLSNMTEIFTVVTFDKEGAWSVNVTTGAFIPSEVTASDNRDVVILQLLSVFANPGSQELVDADGNANFVTKVTMESPNKITLETLMITTYYDSQGGNAGNVTISGDALITYTGRRLLNGRYLQDLEVKPFTLDIPLVSGDNTPKVVQSHEIATSGSIAFAYSFGVVAAAATGVVDAFF